MIRSVYGLKPLKDRWLRGLAAWLLAHRISANQVTVTGLIFGVVAGGCLLLRQDWLALGLVGMSVGADLLDGTMARLTDDGTWRGKILDSVCDRLTEAAWVGALVTGGRLGWWGLSMIAASVLLLLCRIQAQRRGLDSSFVRVTRFERVVAVVALIVFPWSILALLLYGLVVLGTFLSSAQIIWRMGKSIKRSRVLRPGFPE